MEVEMADINKFAERVIDLAERFADITDAAQGKGNRKGAGARWLVLPVAGAGLYALGTNGSFTRKTKKVMNQAKAVGITIVLVAAGTFIILKVIDAVIGLRPTEEQETEGLDTTQHGEEAYNLEA